MAGESVGLAVAFGAGLFSFLSPCVLPLFPSYLSFITGMSVADLSRDLGAAARRRVLLHALAFVAGFSAVFVALGASFGAAGQLLVEHRDPIRRAGGLLIALFGLYVAGVLRPALLGRSVQWQLRGKPAGYAGTLAVGGTFAIGWAPCVGPVLGAILTLAGTTESVEQGVALLLADSAGLGVPFVLSAAALGAFIGFFRRVRPMIPVVERLAGVLLVIVGTLLFTGHYAVLNAWALSLTPDWLLDRLEQQAAYRSVSRIDAGIDRIETVAGRGALQRRPAHSHGTGASNGQSRDEDPRQRTTVSRH